MIRKNAALKLVLASMTLMCLTDARAMTFTPMGDLPGGSFSSFVEAISGDGLTAVGSSSHTPTQSAPFRWTRSGGMTAILGSDSGASPNAYDVSVNGTVVVGKWGTSASEFAVGESFRWTAVDGMQGLGDLPGGWYASSALGVSDDGTTIVGRSISSATGYQGYRWTQATGMVGLGDLAGGAFQSRANDVSSDGAVVVGDGTSAAGVFATRWTSATGLVNLGDLPGGGTGSEAKAISSDGSVIVGTGQSASGTEAFRWTQSGGMIGLGDLPGGPFFSLAEDTSADGSVIVGWSQTASTVGIGSEAFLWSSATGMLNVKQFLMAGGVTGLAGWTLTEAKGISADGKVVVGNGVNAEGNREAWIATLSTAGDFDGDSDVDGNDFLLWQRQELSADANDDDVVDEMDLQIWRDNFAAAAQTPIVVVPEPMPLVMVTFVLILFVRTPPRSASYAPRLAQVLRNCTAQPQEAPSRVAQVL